MFEFFLAIAFIGFLAGHLSMLNQGSESDKWIRYDSKPETLEPCYTREEWLHRKEMMLKKAA